MKLAPDGGQAEDHQEEIERVQRPPQVARQQRGAVVAGPRRVGRRGSLYGHVFALRRSAGATAHTTLTASTPATIHPCRSSAGFPLPNNSAIAGRSAMAHSTSA